MRARKEVIFAYIYGSFLEPQPITFRDVDIGVYVKSEAISKGNAFDYETELVEGLNKVIDLPFDIIDVRVLNFAPSRFQNNVFSRGKLLFCKDEKLLTDLIEETSLEAVANEHIVKQSLRELVS